MRYSDQHIHCSCSPDSKTPVREMVLAAREKGMSMVCFTDHVDMDDSRTGKIRPTPPEHWDECLAAWQDLQLNPVPGIEVRLGMELGGANHLPEHALQYAAKECDFILGSLHNLRDVEDFYFIRYESESQCRELNHLYLRELIELADMDFFDIMAHVAYTSRYMSQQGFHEEITPREYGDELDTLFKKLIYEGRGIECNCSGLYRGHTVYPNAEVLRYYREKGGEFITLGSDGHDPNGAGNGIEQGMALLAGLGFRYVAEYKKHKPDMLRIDI